MKSLLILLLTVGCAFIPGGCRGGLREPALRDRPSDTDAGSTGWPNKLSNRKIELVLSSYGKRSVGTNNRDRRDVIPHLQETASEVEWLCRFYPFLELDSEIGNEVESVPMGGREARAAMVSYMTEKIYPVRMSLRAMRGGRRFILGDYIDSYIRDLELRRSGGGFELIYKKDF